jgi:hypothetical protein
MSSISSRISARAIPMGLVMFNGLQPSCYVGGVGGEAYLAEAQHVAKGLGLVLPPIAVWRPRDEYAGVGQVEASLELKRVCGGLAAKDVSEAKDVLMSRISETRERLGEIEASKSSLVEELKRRPDDEELMEMLRSVSRSRTEMCRSSHLSEMVLQLKTVENALAISNLIPSIIDYAVNVGLRETSDQWLKHLREKGDLTSDIHLGSVLNQSVTTEIKGIF